MPATSRMAGTAVRVVDTCGGYTSLVKALGGVVIHVQPDQPPPFDAFAVKPGQPGALGARIACLQAAIELLAGGLTDQQSSELDYALSFAFAARGYTDDGDTAGLAAPLLSDVVAALENQMSRAFGDVKAQLDALRRALGRYVSGSGTWLFAGSAEPPQDPPMVAYDLSGAPDEERAAATLLALDHACSPVAHGGRPALVLVDEVGELARRPVAARFVARLAEKAVARLIGLRLATDEVTGLLQSPLRALVAGADLKVLMRQSPEAMPLAELLHLTPAEQSWLLAARPGEVCRKPFPVSSTGRLRSRLRGDRLLTVVGAFGRAQPKPADYAQAVYAVSSIRLGCIARFGNPSAGFPQSRP